MKIDQALAAFARRSFLSAATASIIVFIASLASVAVGQNFDSLERGRHKDILKNVKSEIKKNYYDPTFHGMDIDARFKVAEDKLDQATTLAQAQGIIAQAVMDLNDSHTLFLPPSQTLSAEYGWRMEMIGDKCFVTAVKPKSDAEAKGLKPGDEIVGLNNFRPSRQDLWKMEYFYYALSPRAAMQLIVKSPKDAEPRQMVINAKLKQRSRVIDLNSSFDVDDIIRAAEGSGETHRFKEVNSFIIWKMPSFSLDPKDVDDIMRKYINNKNGLILDLRGNPGGAVVALEQLSGYFFDQDIKIADLKGRKEMKPMQGKTQGSNGFKGKLIVLIDSGSASCAEVFPRLVQLEKRGVVIGDKSAGKVMQARTFREQVGVDRVVPYSIEITNADVFMSDGKSLENIGVTPDELIITTGTDLAAQRDPVLAKAFAILGQNITPEDAGKFFPLEWDKDQ